MPLDPTAGLFADDRDPLISHVVDRLGAEIEDLEATIPVALAAQWSPSPIPRPRDDTTERASGGHGDPTSAVATDDRRLALREQIARCRDALMHSAVTVRGARLSLERALAEWEGTSPNG